MRPVARRGGPSTTASSEASRSMSPVGPAAGARSQPADPAAARRVRSGRGRPPPGRPGGGPAPGAARRWRRSGRPSSDSASSGSSSSGSLERVLVEHRRPRGRPPRSARGGPGPGARSVRRPASATALAGLVALLDVVVAGRRPRPGAGSGFSRCRPSPSPGTASPGRAPAGGAEVPLPQLGDDLLGGRGRSPRAARIRPDSASSAASRVTRRVERPRRRGGRPARGRPARSRSRRGPTSRCAGRGGRGCRAPWRPRPHRTPARPTAAAAVGAAAPTMSDLVVGVLVAHRQAAAPVVDGGGDAGGADGVERVHRRDQPEARRRGDHVAEPGHVQLALAHHRDEHVERLLRDPVDLLDVEQRAVAQRGDAAGRRRTRRAT